MTAYVHPLPGAVDAHNFGEQRPGHVHAGDDLSAPLGTPVLAVTDGTVTLRPLNGAAGNTIWLTDQAGNVYKYFHLSAFSVVPGAHVRAGQPIGKVGSTGRSTGPHLHFEYHPGGGAAVDPSPILNGATVTASTSTTVPTATASVNVPGLPFDPTLLVNPRTWLRVVMVVGGAGLTLLGVTVIVRETKAGRQLTDAGIEAAKLAAVA